MSNEEKSLTTREETIPRIPDAHIDSVIDLSDDIAMWCKLVRGGFQFANQDKIIPELVGRVVSITPYLINLDAGDRVPAKLPHVKSDLEIPEGYSRRCDIKIVNGGQVVGISLAPSSTKFQLSPYLKYLKNQGLRPENVVTRVTSKQVSNNMGTFQVAVFEMVDGKGKPSDTSQEYAPFESFPEEWD